MLGLWLGDGTTMEPEITNIDEAILIYIKKYAMNNNLRVTKRGKITYYIAGNEYRQNSFLNALKYYKLIGNKHIPYDYLHNSREIRLKVLAGLIDTDGYMYDNMYEISQKSDTLSNDIVKLTRSLGFKTHHYKKNKTCVKPDKSRVTGLYNMVTISGEKMNEIPCLLERKRTQPSRKNIDFLITPITVTDDGISEFIGLQIEGNSNFFAPDYTVWHNSTPTKTVFH